MIHKQNGKKTTAIEFSSMTAMDDTEKKRRKGRPQSIVLM